MRTDEFKNEINKIKKWEDKIKRKVLKYKAGKYKYDFQQYETTTSFGKNIYSGKTSIHEADMGQTNLLENMEIFSKKSRTKKNEGKDKCKILLIV